MSEVELAISRLAALGCSPYQIETELGLPHFTIHVDYHGALQAGYARAAGLSYSKSDELKGVPPEPIERRSNKEKTAERKRRYQQENKEKIAERQRQYYMANREKICAQRRRRYEKKQEEIREQVREFIKAQEAKNAIKQEAKKSLQTASR